MVLSEEKRRWLSDIYERHWPAIRHYCFTYMKNDADADDIVQETFCRLATQPIDFIHDKQVRAWLYTTAGNLCKDRLRHWGRKTAPLDDDSSLRSNETLDIETKLDLYDATMKLPVKYREVIFLYYYGFFSQREIAAQLALPESTVHTRLRRAKQMLEKLIGEGLYD